MRANFWILLIALAVWTPQSAQAEMKINGSSQAAFERSVKAMTRNMSKSDKQAFTKGLLNLILTRYPPAAGAKGLQLFAFMGEATKAAHRTMDGVSRSDILQHGRRLQAKSAAKARTSSKVAKFNRQKLRCLQRHVSVSAPAFKRGRYSEYVELKLTNRLTWAIAGVRLSYKVLSAGRSVPWTERRVSTSVKGGIEPGETRAVSVSVRGVPKHVATKDLIVEVSVLDVADAQKRLVVGGVTVIGWSKEPSQKPCG